MIVSQESDLEEHLHNFSFSDYAGKNVRVFISGPGYLEYPWALETASRLKEAGSIVSVMDLSALSLPLSMRLVFWKVTLPVVTRPILRRFLLKKHSRLEHLFFQAAKNQGIPILKPRIPRRKLFRKLFEKTQLKNYDGVLFKDINARQILESFLSSKYRRRIDSEFLFPKSVAHNLEEAIRRTHLVLEMNQEADFGSNPLDNIFLSNGRQPVQAAIRSFYRAKGVHSILYESAGGYISPKKLTLKIDYFYSWPTNAKEQKKKIRRHFESATLESKNEGESLLNELMSGSTVAYSINYSAPLVKVFDDSLLGPGKNFAYFASSDWELSIIQQEPFYQPSQEWTTQFEGVQSLLNVMRPEDRLFLRLHPNDPTISYKAETYWSLIAQDPRVHLIDNNSLINSFDLARKVDLCLTWNSFIGLELFLHEIPCLFLGESMFTYSIEELAVSSKNVLKEKIRKPQTFNFQKWRLLPLMTYLANGGFAFTTSMTNLTTKSVFIGNTQSDIARLNLHKLLPRLIRSIS